MDHDSAHVVPRAARQGADAVDAPLLLAVSGGLDSMALLAAMAGAARERVAGVATFDHGTGPVATVAAEHVARVAGALGLPVIVGRMDQVAHPPDGWEAAWRRARYRFLAEAAESLGARVATAHTRDDQVETVLMRVLRGSGARGLAGLEAPSPIVRPFLRVSRAALASFVRDAGIEWVEDPGNRSPAHLRNRVRHDLLPALRRSDPGIDDALLETGRRAARWRAEFEAMVDRALDVRTDGDGGLVVARRELGGYDRGSLAVVWGALAGRVGLALDRRGTHRLATFTMQQPVGGRMPLSGGWCVEARRTAFHLRPWRERLAAPATLPAAGTVEWGRFRFRAARDTEVVSAADRWAAWLPSGGVVRAWSAGDRLAPAGGQPRRRVARYLSDAGLGGSEREAWPVVVAGEVGAGDVVWIPGVRRSDAATERSGRPVQAYVCERIAP